MVEGLEDAVFTVLQCDRFHVVGVAAPDYDAGVPAQDYGAGTPTWRLTSPLAIRMRGEQVLFDRMLGSVAVLHPGDWPVIATKVCPGEPFHDSVLKAHAALEQLERVQAYGIIIPGQEEASS